LVYCFFFRSSDKSDAARFIYVFQPLLLLWPNSARGRLNFDAQKNRDVKNPHPSYEVSGSFAEAECVNLATLVFDYADVIAKKPNVRTRT